jgi:hypothetical protein
MLRTVASLLLTAVDWVGGSNSSPQALKRGLQNGFLTAPLRTLKQLAASDVPVFSACVYHTHVGMDDLLVLTAHAYLPNEAPTCPNPLGDAGFVRHGH